MNFLELPLSYFGVMTLQAFGLQLIFGGAGLLTLGHCAFFFAGGYASALVSLSLQQHHLPPAITFTLAITSALLSSVVFASLLGWACLRFGGDYLAFVTLGFAQILENTLGNIAPWGGPSGLTQIPHLTLAWFIWVLVAVIGMGLHRFYQSDWGRALSCVREDEIIAQNVGLTPWHWKAGAFLMGNMITALAGALYAHSIQYLSPNGFFQKSVEILFALVLGGSKSIRGAIFGAAFLTLLPQGLQLLPHSWNPSLKHPQLWLAILTLILLRYFPSGIFKRSSF